MIAYSTRQQALEDEFFLRQYDSVIRGLIPESYNYPIRMRDWELGRVIASLQGGGYGKVLETGSFNTFLGLYLSTISDEVIISDIYGDRIKENILRRLGIWKKRRTQAPFEKWFYAMKYTQKNIHFKSVNLLKIPFDDNYFDLITSISVIEHIPNPKPAYLEMIRCLKPGGKLLISTDISNKFMNYKGGVKHFTVDELTDIFDLSEIDIKSTSPDFSKENWLYHQDKPILNTYLEIQKS
jgi:SAM-dependent methyltransferase